MEELAVRKEGCRRARTAGFKGTMMSRARDLTVHSGGRRVWGKATDLGPWRGVVEEPVGSLVQGPNDHLVEIPWLRS